MWLSLFWPLQPEATAPAGTETPTLHFLRAWEQSAGSSIDIPASCPRKPVLGNCFRNICAEYQERVSEGHKGRGSERESERHWSKTCKHCTSSWFSLLLVGYKYIQTNVKTQWDYDLFLDLLKSLLETHFCKWNILCFCIYYCHLWLVSKLFKYSLDWVFVLLIKSAWN